jgi:hypothetical protein
MQRVAFGEEVGVGRVVEVPHQRCGIQEVDGSYTERHNSRIPVLSRPSVARSAGVPEREWVLW